MITRRLFVASGATTALYWRPAAAAGQPAGSVLRIAYPGAILKPAMEEIGRLFAKRNLDAPTILDPLVRSYEELAQRTLRGALVGDFPDVALHSTTTLRPLVARDLAAPLDDLIQRDPAWQGLGLHENITSFGTIDGRVYGLPWGVSTPCLVVNVDLVRSSGQDPSSLPTDWGGVLALARRIAETQAVMGGFFEYDHTHSSMFQGLVLCAGGQILASNGRSVAFENEVGLKALELVDAFRGVGAVDMSRDQARQLFAAGRLGILVTSSSVYSGLRRQAGNRFTATLAPFPIDAAKGALPAGGPLLVLHKRGTHIHPNGWRYVSFSLSPEAQAAMVKEVGYFSLNRRLLTESGHLSTYLGDNPSYRTGVSKIDRFGRFADFPGQNSLRISDVMKEQIRRLVTGVAKPKVVLADMAREINNLLNE